jgi:YVTN family beta-propeller protein
MKTKYPLLKRFSGTRLVSGMLASLLALSLTAVSAAVAAPFAYVSNFTSPGTVSVIDQATNTVVASITVGNLPGGVAVNPAGTRAYVANKDDGTVSVINVVSNTVETTIRVGPEPWGIGVSADSSRVYVANGGNGTVSLIEVNRGNAVTTIPTTGGLLNGVVVVGSRAYVSDASTGGVIVIDGTAQVTAVEVGTPLNSQPMGIVANQDGTRVYVVDLIDDFRGRILEVSAIDTATNTVVAGETFFVEEDTMAAPSGLAISPDDSRLYVVNDDRNWVTVVTLASPRTFRNVPVGMAPFGVALDRVGARVYVGNTGGQSVSVIDTATNTVLTTVGVGRAPFAFGAFVTDGPQAPTQFELTLTTVGDGSITADRAPVAGTAMYDAGTVVNLTATPGAGSQFSGWSEDCSGTGACQVRMDRPRRVTATCTVVPPPPTDPPPTTCDDKIKDLQKKAAGYKHGWWHKYDLRMALRMYSEALAKLDKAKAKVGALDRRYVHAQKQLDNGKAALCADRYRRAHHEFWEAYEIAQRILRQSHYRR